MSGKGSKRRTSFTDPIHYCLHGSLFSLSFSLEPVQMCSEKKGTSETCPKMCSRKDEKHALIKTCKSNPTTTSTTTFNRKAQTKGRSERSSRAPSLVSAARTHATKRKSLPVAANRDGGGVGLPGTGSPRKTFALDRWIQHEITAYQRCTSADGSRPRAAARLCASALMNPTVSCAQKP